MGAIRHDRDERPCVHVGGLARAQLTHEQMVLGDKQQDVIVDELLLGDFFYGNGCKVKEVRLIIDGQRDCSRGFAYVDFEDEDSVEKALKLDGTKEPEVDGVPIKLDTKNMNGIQIKRPRRRSAPAQEAQWELTKEMNSTEELMQEFRLREARVHEMAQELEREYKRLQRAAATDDIKGQIQKQQELQANLRRKIDETVELERVLESQLCQFKSRRRGHERFVASFDSGDIYPQNAVLQMPDLQDGAELDLQPATKELLRTISERSVPRDPSRSNWEELVDRTKEPEQLGHPTTGGSPSNREELEDGTKERDKHSANAPAGLMRATSLNSAPETKRRSWAQMLDEEEDDVDADPIWNQPVPIAPTLSADATEKCGTQPCSVRIAGLPALPKCALEDELRDALLRFWRAASRTSPPAVSSICVKGLSDEASSDARSWVEVARKNTAQKNPEATVTFIDGGDAQWLIDRLQSSALRCAREFTLRGHRLRVSYADMPEPTDFRKFRPNAGAAGDDAASNISYISRSTQLGTVHSHGSRIQGQKITAAVGGPDDKSCPVSNRTVVLEGLPRSLPVYNIQEDVISAIVRAYNKGSFFFDPDKHFHYGVQGGITVKEPTSRADQNGGACFLKFRFYSDAKWFVDQARVIRVGGVQVRATWRKVRGG